MAAFVAALLALPIVAVILTMLTPGRGPGHFALTQQFGPVRLEHESERHYQLKLARWWAAGSLLLPLGMVLARLLRDAPAPMRWA